MEPPSIDHSRDGSARNAASFFLVGLKRKSDEKRVRTARELYRFIHGDMKDESQQYINEFLSSLDSKDQSALVDCIHSHDVDEKKAGIFLIVCLLESSTSGEASRVNRYANLLLKSLTMSNMDEQTMELAARGISYLIQTSKVVELVNKCMDQCLEWLEETDRQEKRRLAAALLTRELALFTSTSFFSRASNFFKNIFKVIHDPKANIRVAAVNALHAALTITSQRETKQKMEWYKECFNEAINCITDHSKELSRDDRLHAMLLVFNELIKISDAKFERYRQITFGQSLSQEIVGSGNPIDWLTESRTLHIVESRTARNLVMENLTKIISHSMDARSSRSPHVQGILLELYPRLCALNSDNEEKCKDMFEYTMTQIKTNPQLAIPSLGLFFREIQEERRELDENGEIIRKKERKDVFLPYLPQIMMIVGDNIAAAHAKKRPVDQSIFIFLKLLVRSYKTDVRREIKQLLPQIMSSGLSNGLCQVLKDMLAAIPEMTEDIQNGLLEHLSQVLAGISVPKKFGKIDRQMAPPVDTSNSELICLALETISEFNFPRYQLQMYVEYIADTFLVSDNVDIRMAAVKCSVYMLHPFVKIYNQSHPEHKPFLQELIYTVLARLVSVGVIDSKVDVRLGVINAFSISHSALLMHLSQPTMMDMLFMTLHDEKPEMQITAVKLMGRMASLNGSFVLPRLRRILLEALSQLTTSGNARLEQHSARLIAQVTRQSPDFMKPYVTAVLSALLPKLRAETRHSDVTVEVLEAIGELSVVGGVEIVRAIKVLFERLTHYITDSSNRKRREAALSAIARLCRSTAYVVDPYRDYPTLLDDLLRLLKTEMNSGMRRQTIQTLGVLGALDPYNRRIYIGDVQSASSISTALSMPCNTDKSDPRQEIIQWFNYEKCTLEEFYPSITIANLMLMVQDEAFTAFYDQIIQALLTIFRSLSTEEYKIYVEQVLPRLIEVTRNCRSVVHRKFFLSQLANFVSIVQLHSKNHLKAIFHIIAEAWSDETSMKHTIVQVMEQMGTALGSEFSSFVPELIPYLLKVVQSDRSPDRRLTAKVLSCVRALSGCLTPHLHLVLPPILAIVDDNGVVMNVRESALETIFHLARTEEVVEFAPRLMQVWLRVIDVEPLQKPLLRMLVVVARQMWKHFDVYRKAVETALTKHHLECAEYEQLTKTAAAQKYKPVANQSSAPNPLPYDRSNRTVPRPIQMVARLNKQKFNVDVVRSAWLINSLASKEDWTQWLGKLRIACIRFSSSAAIRAAAPLAEQHTHLAKDLFNAGFMSVWTELDQNQQDEVTQCLQNALRLSGQHDIVQTILNLAEFMDHSEKGPLPIQNKILGRSAEETKAYAKALRYKEIDIHKRLEEGGSMTADDCRALITFANKLNVQDEAAGVVSYAECHQMEHSMQGKWYEKLNEWEKALESYQTEEDRESVAPAEMRCLEALGRWKELNERATVSQARSSHKVAVMAARGAWAEGQFERMNTFVNLVNLNSFDGSFLRSALAVRNEDYRTASDLIGKVRDMYDSELTAMAGESYERAYGAMVLVQQLAELEECIEYKMRRDRRVRIALLWARRLIGCRQNVEQWQRLLMLRELVMKPRDMQPLKVKFASLCRKQGRHDMAREVLRQLLELPLNAELHSASAPQDKPELVIALCKQLWNDGIKGSAITTMDGLSRHLERVCVSGSATNEKKRLAAKVYVKLGEWTAAQAAAMLEQGVTSRSNSLAGIPSVETMTQSQDTGPHPVHIQSMARSVGAMTISGHSNQEAIVTAKVLKYLTRATELDRGWHKAWHRLATTYYAACQRDREKGSLRQSSQTNQLSGGMSPAATTTTSCVSPGGTVQPSLPTAPAPLAANLPGTVDSVLAPLTLPVQPLLTFQTSPIPSVDVHTATINKLGLEAVKCFIEALKLAKGSRLEDTLRLLALIFDVEESLSNEMRNGMKKLPAEMWLEVVPQLIARLDSPPRLASLIKQIILDVSKVYPQALVYALTVAAKSSNVERSKNAKELCELFSDMSPKHKSLWEQSKMLTEELVRCAILWHEQWHEALDEASRLYFQEKNVQGMLDVLEPMHKLIEAGANTIKEHSFNQTYFADLQDARKFCQAFSRTKNVKELTQAWEIYYGIFKRVQGQLRQLSSLDLTYISPKLKEARDLEISVPGTYDPQQEVVTISWLDTHLQVISSKQRPRKMTMRGSNGKDYQFLLKGHEDPRQDERVMQLFGLVNTLLNNNAETCRRNLTIQRYSIVALSQNSGLIGWVPNCDTLHTLVREYRDKKKIPLSLEHKEMQQHVAELEQLTLLQKVQLFEIALKKTPGDDLRQILWLKSPSSEVWFDRRTNYTRSMAVMSMVGYILGLGDRHPSNLMLDRLTGKIVHIDFGDCFEVAMSREKFPEKIPFRLTRMLIKAMEVTGIEGNYRHTCERVLRLLRTNKESLLAVLEAFVYDPLINWRLLDANKRNPGEKQDPLKMKTNEILPASVSRKIVDRIKNKLTGRDFDVDYECGVAEQLTRLVEQATLHDNLCQCYIGWCPFW